MAGNFWSRAGGQLPFTSLDYDPKKTDIAVLRKERVNRVLEFLQSQKFSNTDGQIRTIQPIAGDNLHHGERLVLRCPVSLRLLCGASCRNSFQTSAIALSYLEKSHRRRQIFATWGLILIEQHTKIAMDYIAEKTPLVDDELLPPPIFDDVIQSRTVQADGLVKLLGAFDRYCSIHTGGVDHWDKLDERQKVLVDFGAFCLLETFLNAGNYRKIVQWRNQRSPFEDGRLPRHIHAHSCHMMSYGSDKVPYVIASKAARPLPSRSEIWGIETERNRRIMAKVKQALGD